MPWPLNLWGHRSIILICTQFYLLLYVIEVIIVTSAVIMMKWWNKNCKRKTIMFPIFKLYYYYCYYYFFKVTAQVIISFIYKMEQLQSGLGICKLDGAYLFFIYFNSYTICFYFSYSSLLVNMHQTGLVTTNNPAWLLF